MKKNIDTSIEPYTSKVKHLSQEKQFEHIIKGLIRSTQHYKKIENGINAIGEDDCFINCIADFEWTIYMISGFVNDKIHPDLRDGDHIRQTLNELLWNTELDQEAVYKTYSKIEDGYRRKGQLKERAFPENILDRTLSSFIAVARIYKALKSIVESANNDSEIYSFSGSPAAELIIDIIDLLYPDHFKTDQDQEEMFEAILELPHLITEAEIKHSSDQIKMIIDSLINSLKK